MEYVKCNLCGIGATRTVFLARDTNIGTEGEFPIVQCRNCGFVYSNPRLTGEALAIAYNSERYGSYQTIFHDVRLPTPEHLRRAKWLSMVCQTGTMVDIGCGDGLFLKAMESHKWRVIGLEPDERAINFGREKLGLDVRDTVIEDISEEQLELVTLWDSLEHLPDPTYVLSRVNEKLKSGGRVAISVPNWDSLERKVFQAGWIAVDAPRHLSHFTPDSLRRLLTKTGFETESLEMRAPVMSLASNILRWLGNSVLRDGKRKSGNAISCSNTLSNSPGRISERKKATIRATYVILSVPNVWINLAGKGASITALARKIR